ncbi:hypothetical protein N7504_000160 [Penicillium tannophilum]|nr:hypothetical protein N7504_000160 [Penicillium tannophilum]
MKGLAIIPSTWQFVLLVLLSAWWAYILTQKRRQNQAKKICSDEHGCQPILKRLPYKWPLAIDIFVNQYKALVNGNLLDYQADYFQKHMLGPTFEVKLLGRVGYFTTDPRNLEAMLQTNFTGNCIYSSLVQKIFSRIVTIEWELGSSRNSLSPMIGHGIFTQDGSAWKHSREILRRQFARIQYQNTSVFEGPVDDLLRTLHSSKGVVDLQPAFFRFTLATTTSLIFGEPSTSLNQRDHDEFASTFDYTSLVSAMRMRLADCHYVNYALTDMKENGEKAAAQRHPFILDLFRELQDPKLVRNQLMNILLAGRDTTACLMSWACYQLVRHPAVLKRLREEVISFTQDDVKLTRAHIAKMKYLKCVLNETNRLYTQIPVNVRIARNTTYLPKGGGTDGESPVIIPKGTGVGFSAYHMHRSKDLYGEDANKYRPERWEGPELKNIGFAFMPFHGGPRLCLGKDFALTEASYGLVRLIQTFPGLSKAPDAPILAPGKEKQKLTVVVSSADGCKVLLH